MENYTKILDDVCDPLTVRKFAEQASLSRKDAISALEKYIEAKGEPVWALYEVSGVVDSSEYPFFPEGEKILKHVVVPGSALEETKKRFDEVISTCLHSIQRSNPKETRVYGRSWADNDDLQGKTFSVQFQPKKAVETPIVEVKKEKSAEPEQKPSTYSTSNAKTDAKKGTIVPLKKQANISSMFSKKKIAEKEKSASPPPAEPEKKTRKRPKIEIDEPEEPMEVVEEERTPEKKTPSRHSDDDLPSSREQSVEKEKSPPAKRQKKTVNDENKKAKRRLIVPESDEEEEEVKKPKNARMEINKEEKSKKPEERRRTTRIEKIVETYVDEDGYLVSKEVQKAVECSPQKASPEKPKAKMITAPIPGAAKVPKKNSTITSFFKKA